MGRRGEPTMKDVSFSTGGFLVMRGPNEREDRILDVKNGVPEGVRGKGRILEDCSIVLFSDCPKKEVRGKRPNLIEDWVRENLGAPTYYSFEDV